MIGEDDIAAVLAHVESTVGLGQAGWTAWPGGWPNDIESSLVDAVFSARARYEHVHARVLTWQQTRKRTTFSLLALRAEIDALQPDGWAKHFGNSQVSPSRPANAPGGRTKAATVRQACDALLAMQVDTSASITSENSSDVRVALLGVPGVGYATANYFFMLLGAPGVKPDRMVHRFLSAALRARRRFTNEDAEQVVAVVAARVGVQPHELDHAIWCFESARARQHSGLDGST
jgi:endonuclease III